MKPSRLQRAREMAGLSIAQAVKLLGYGDSGPAAAANRATLEEIELRGDAGEWLIGKLARLYGVRVAWLRGEDLVLRPETEALLRSVENTTDREKLRELLIATQGRPR